MRKEGRRENRGKDEKIRWKKMGRKDGTCHVNFHTLDRDKKARQESKRERKRRRKKEKEKERERGERERKSGSVGDRFFSKPPVFTLIVSLLCSITEEEE